jgi:hypothetical protein
LRPKEDREAPGLALRLEEATKDGPGMLGGLGLACGHALLDVADEGAAHRRLVSTPSDP